MGRTMRLIWHGTASVEVAGEDGRILFDPFVPLPGSGVPVALADFDGFAHIFVTHGHFDHISGLPEIVRRNPEVKIHCTQVPYRTLTLKGVAGRNLAILDYGDVVETCGFSVEALHGKHAVLPGASLARLAYMLKSPARRNLPHIVRENRACVEGDETVFYQIRADGKTVSLMGSLNLRDEVAYPTGADLLVLPYNGWEDNFQPAMRTIERLRPKRIVLDHYDDTFPPVTMPLDLGPLLDRYGGLVATMELGAVVEV